MSSKKRKQARDKLTHAAPSGAPRPARSPDPDVDDAPDALPAPSWRRRAALIAYIGAVTLLALSVALLYVAPTTALSLGQGGLQGLRLAALALLLGGLWLGRKPPATNARHRR